MSFRKPRCTLVSRRQHCVTGVQCRQKCSDEFPVPQGWITCSGVQGQFEGDTCTVECGRHFRRRGDPKAFCTGGVWTSQMGGGRPASAKCISVGRYLIRELEVPSKSLSSTAPALQRSGFEFLSGLSRYYIRSITARITYFKLYLEFYPAMYETRCTLNLISVISVPFDFNINGSYCIYQRYQHINEANGSFCIVLTH